MTVVDIERIKQEALEESYKIWKTDFFQNRLILLTEPQIREGVCAEFDVSWDEINGPRRTAKVALPRQVYCFLMKRLTMYTLNDIAEFIGYTDHSSVRHCLIVMKNYLETDEMVKNRIINLVIKLNHVAGSN